MKVMNRYAAYVERITGSEEIKESNVECENCIVKEEIMLRGNNRKNIYSIERVRVGSNDRKRGYTNYRR